MQSFAVPSLSSGTIWFPGSPRLRTTLESVMREPPPDTLPSERLLEDRLDSWKEIAEYLSRDVTTVQRWEKREGMPVHRHLHDRMGSVYAFRSELDASARGRNLRIAQENGNDALPVDTPAQTPPTPFTASPGKTPKNQPPSNSAGP